MVKIHSLLLQSPASFAELGHALYTFFAYCFHCQWDCLSQLACCHEIPENGRLEQQTLVTLLEGGGPRSVERANSVSGEDPLFAVSSLEWGL